jgi:hypothetical protein
MRRFASVYVKDSLMKKMTAETNLFQIDYCIDNADFPSTAVIRGLFFENQLKNYFLTKQQLPLLVKDLSTGKVESIKLNLSALATFHQFADFNESFSPNSTILFRPKSSTFKTYDYFFNWKDTLFGGQVTINLDHGINYYGALDFHESFPAKEKINAFIVPCGEIFKKYKIQKVVAPPRKEKSLPTEVEINGMNSIPQFAVGVDLLDMRDHCLKGGKLDLESYHSFALPEEKETFKLFNQKPSH